MHGGLSDRKLSVHTPCIHSLTRIVNEADLKGRLMLMGASVFRTCKVSPLWRRENDTVGLVECSIVLECDLAMSPRGLESLLAVTGGSNEARKLTPTVKRTAAMGSAGSTSCTDLRTSEGICAVIGRSAIPESHSTSSAAISEAALSLIVMFRFAEVTVTLADAAVPWQQVIFNLVGTAARAS